MPQEPSEGDDVARLEAGRRLPQLDGLRGVAILLILFLHFIVRAPVAMAERPFAHAPDWLRALVDLSWCGVDLFFVLSGFLIGGILLDHRGSPNLWRAFYSRRISRIFPAYFLLLALSALRVGGVPEPKEGTIPLAAYAFFVQNLWGLAPPFAWLGPCWSIAIEEQFYLTAPAFIARLSRRGLLVLLGMAIVAPPVLRLMATFAPNLLPFRMSSWDFTLCRIDAPAFGVLGAWMVRDANVHASIRDHLPSLKTTTAVLITACLFMSQASRDPSSSRWLLTLGLTLLAITSLGVVLVAVVDAEGMLSRMLRFRPLTVAGKYSYFVYLFHMMFLLLAVVHLPEAPLWQAESIAMLALGLFAWTSWRFIEQPMINRGHAVRYEAVSVR